VVELMNVREQVDLDYARAHRRALFGGFLAWVRGRCTSLRAFEEAHRELGAENRRHLGRRTVEADGWSAASDGGGSSTQGSCPRGRARSGGSGWTLRSGRAGTYPR
jgi:hypothetical protein